MCWLWKSEVDSILRKIAPRLRTNGSAAFRWPVTHIRKSKKLLALTFDIYGKLWNQEPRAVR